MAEYHFSWQTIPLTRLGNDLPVRRQDKWCGGAILLDHVSSRFLSIPVNSRPAGQVSYPISGGRPLTRHRSRPTVRRAVHTSAAAHPGAPSPILPLGVRAGVSRRLVG